MIKKSNNTSSLFSSLSDMLNQSHPPYQLTDKIDLKIFETVCQSTIILLGQWSFWQANPFNVWYAHPKNTFVISQVSLWLCKFLPMKY